MRTHGVRGGLRVGWLDALDALRAMPETLTLSHRDGRSQPFEVRSIAPLGQDSLVLLEGLTSPEAGRCWHGADVLIERTLIPHSKPGERYLFELVGLSAQGEDGLPLGDIVAVYDHGATPLLALRAPRGEERLVPLLDDTLRETRFGEGLAILRVLPGLW